MVTRSRERLPTPAIAAARAGGTAADWRLQLAEPRRRQLRAWFLAIAGLTLGVLVVGGITRLTRSGLSIVDWDPIMGVVPPLTHEQWQAAFERYRQFPEYQQLRQGMSLGEFRFIYFWEYGHRVLARLMGAAFLLPFVFFWLRGYFSRPLAARALLLFGLGALQGVMGWLMVASGLVDRPSVSHFRLAAHLSLAFLIFGYALWLARELAVTGVRPALPAPVHRLLRRGLALTGVLLVLQIVWGAFVAGLRAGQFANTFPLMAGRLVPPGLLAWDPPVLAFLENPLTVQWTHRVLGTILLLAVAGLALRVHATGEDARSRRLALLLLALTALQYALGVLTLLHYVPVALGVTHQLVALLLFGTWVVWVHHLRQINPAT
jgi:cytochrome c oxidase assembly protein subunit 15